MKKNILKFTGLAALAALMTFNIQLFQGDMDPSASLAYLVNKAFADGENGDGFAPQPQQGTKNVSCTKEIEVGIAPPKFKWVTGRRDKCKGEGDGCTPTSCI